MRFTTVLAQFSNDYAQLYYVPRLSKHVITLCFTILHVQISSSSQILRMPPLGSNDIHKTTSTLTSFDVLSAYSYDPITIDILAGAQFVAH